VLTDTTRAVSDGTGPTTKPKYTTGENQITKKDKEQKGQNLKFFLCKF